MDRVAAELIAFRELDHLAEIHDADAVGDVAHNADIVCDEQIGQVLFTLQILQHVDDLRLDRHVQRRDRLVTDDELRLHRQGTRDADALLLAAGKLVRKAVGVLGVQADFIQQLVDPLPPFRLPLKQAMDIQGFADDLADRHARVERRRGILKDDLHLAPVRQHLHSDVLFAVIDRRSVIDDPPAGGLVQADNGSSEGGLAAAGLADDAKRLAPVDEKGHRFDGLHIFLFEQAVALDGEILFEVFNLKKNFLITHWPYSPSPCLPLPCSRDS